MSYGYLCGNFYSVQIKRPDRCSKCNKIHNITSLMVSLLWRWVQRDKMPKMLSCLRLTLDMDMTGIIYGGSSQCSERHRCEYVEILTHCLLVGEVLRWIWALFRAENSSSPATPCTWRVDKDNYCSTQTQLGLRGNAYSGKEMYL